MQSVGQKKNKTHRKMPQCYNYKSAQYEVEVIYKALCFDVAQGQMNGAPNETRTHLCRFASLAC